MMTPSSCFGRCCVAWHWIAGLQCGARRSFAQSGKQKSRAKSGGKGWKGWKGQSLPGCLGWFGCFWWCLLAPLVLALSAFFSMKQDNLKTCEPLNLPYRKLHEQLDEALYCSWISGFHICSFKAMIIYGLSEMDKVGLVFDDFFWLVMDFMKFYSCCKPHWKMPPEKITFILLMVQKSG